MIAIMSIAREEIGHFKSMTTIQEEDIYAGMSFTTGFLGGTEVVLVCTEMGHIPAVAATQIAIDRYQADTIIVSGPAGPLVPYLQQGDIVIADRVMHYDSVSGNRHESQNDIDCEESLIVNDPGMSQRLTDGYNRIFGTRSNRPQMIIGPVISCNHAISDRKTISHLQREYGAVAIDRDGAMVAQACRMNDVPFLFIRTVIDSPDGDFYNQFDLQLQVVPEYITALVTELIGIPQEALVV